jgi:hypothetical protein
MNCLQTDFLSDLLQAVKDDHDLNLEIRDGYINIYFKGYSLLKLSEGGPHSYKVNIHNKFTNGLDFPREFTDEQTTGLFVRSIPALKQNIIRCGKGSLEIEYEQMIIRANNFEPRNNSDYFIIDRQYTVDTGRFDLVGIFWGRKGRRKHQEVDLCLMEVKFALNQDISEVHEQLARYFDALKPRAGQIAEEFEIIFRQKLELGLYYQSQDRLEAMKTLKVSRDFSRFQFVLIMVDYNPNSAKLALSKISDLPFANQVKVFTTGMAMWQQNVRSIQQAEEMSH